MQVLNEKKKKIRELKSRGTSLLCSCQFTAEGKSAHEPNATGSVGGAVHQSDEEDSRWPLANATSRPGPAGPEEPVFDENENDEGDPHRGTSRATDPSVRL